MPGPAGLNVVHRSGIFFKALANFQWDRLLATDIISPEYLEGCYQLGHVYPGPVLEHLPGLRKGRPVAEADTVILGVMQPYFLPYIGYWQLLAAVDRFVVYDNIQYTKKGWINRNRFLRNGADAYFTVPVKKGSDFLDVADRAIADDFDPAAMLRQLAVGLSKGAALRRGVPGARGHRHGAAEQPVRVSCMHSLEVTAGYLGIRTPIVVSSTVAIDHDLRSEHKVIALCRALGANATSTRSAGAICTRATAFAESGIELRFLQSRPIDYPQFDEPFVPALSILDVLMFNSRNAVRRMLGEYDLV